MHSSPENKQSLAALWLFIIGVLAVELLLRILPEAYMTRIAQHRAEEIRYLPAAEIQLMGDSTTSAISVPIINEVIGGESSTSNYALPGVSPLFNYFILRRQIAEQKPPKLIVLSPHPFILGDDLFDRFNSRFATIEESIQTLRDGVHLDDWLYGNLCRISYTLRYRKELYECVTLGDVRFFQTLNAPVSSVQNTRAKIVGHTPRAEVPKAVNIRKNEVNPVLRAQSKIHPYNAMYLDKLCALAAANGIEILWISMPLPEMVNREFPNPERNLPYVQFIEQKKNSHSNLHGRAEIPELPDSYFTDHWHLNQYGAQIFSELIGKQIAEHLRERPLK